MLGVSFYTVHSYQSKGYTVYPADFYVCMTVHCSLLYIDLRLYIEYTPERMCRPTGISSCLQYIITQILRVEMTSLTMFNFTC